MRKGGWYRFDTYTKGKIMDIKLKKALALLNLRHKRDVNAQCYDDEPFNWGHFGCKRCFD